MANEIELKNLKQTQKLIKDNEIKENSNLGDFIINPGASDTLFIEIERGVFDRIKSAKYNPDLSLSGISNLNVLDEYANRDGRWYQIERIIANSIEKKEINNEIIFKLLEWNKNEGKHRKNSEDYESYIIKPLVKNGLINEDIIDWLMKNRSDDTTMLELIDRNLLTPDQIKEITVNGKDSYIKWQLIKRGIINSKDFSSGDIEKLYLNTSKEIMGSNLVYCEIAEHILPNFQKEEQAKFVQKAIEEIIYLFEEREKENKQKDEGGFPSEYGSIIRAITRNAEYLSDEQIISLIQGVPSIFCSEFRDNLPGWAFQGLLLKHEEKFSKFQHNAIRDFDKEEYKEKYALMGRMFSKEPPLAEILTEKEQAEIIEDVMLYGFKLFEPIYPASEDEEDTITLLHISGKPYLKYLTPNRARSTDRFLQDYAVYLQSGEFDDWQVDHLKMVNEGILYNYKIRLPKKLFSDKVVYGDNRWEGGYKTRRPIIFDKKTPLTWKMFNPIMKMETFAYYEKIFGKLPEDIKNRLMGKSDSSSNN